MKEKNIKLPKINKFLNNASYSENILKNKLESELTVKDIFFVKKLYSNKL